jgi:uncharacterized protein YybS (DUF2232 family)
MRQRRWLAVASETLLAGLLGVGLFVSGRFFPVLGVLLSLLAPVPAVILGLRHGRAPLLAAVGLTALALAGLTTPRYAVAFALEFALPGLLLAELLRRTTRSEGVVIAVAALLTLGACGVLLLEPASRQHPFARVEQQVLALVTEAEQLMANLGLPGEVAPPAAGVRSPLGTFLVMAFPGILFAGNVLTAWGYVLLVGALIRRWPALVPGPAPEWWRWQLPEQLVWAFIGAGLLYLTGWPWLQVAGLNALIVLLALYFLQGLSIAVFVFKRYQLPRTLGALSVVLLLFQPLLALVVAGVGLFDVWFSFRRLSYPRSPGPT